MEADMSIFETGMDSALAERVETVDLGDPEQVVELVDEINGYKQQAREFFKMIESELMARMHDAGADRFEAGDAVVAVRKTRTAKCTDNRAAFNSLMEHFSGDLGKVLGFLKSDAFKPGAARGVLDPVEYDAAFENRYSESFSIARESKEQIAQFAQKG